MIMKAWYEIHTYDYAVPQPWFDDVIDRTGVNPCGCFVWLYDGKYKTFGRPYPINVRGWVICKMLNIEF
jgi:hypothetical protein